LGCTDRLIGTAGTSGPGAGASAFVPRPLSVRRTLAIKPPICIDTNRVFPDVTADDLGHQAGIDFLCTAVVGQSSSPQLI